MGYPEESTLRRVQHEQVAWIEHNFGKRPLWQPVMGVGEEAGELQHSCLKLAQGIKGTPEEHAADMRDALADIIIFCCDVASALGIDLDVALSETWAMVRKRDFKADATTGGGHGHAGGTGDIR